MAESALDTCDWDPRRAFLFARDLAIAVKKTRHLASQAVSHPSFSNQRFPIDAVTLVYDKVSDLFFLTKQNTRILRGDFLLFQFLIHQKREDDPLSDLTLDSINTSQPIFVRVGSYHWLLRWLLRLLSRSCSRKWPWQCSLGSHPTGLRLLRDMLLLKWKKTLRAA